MATERDAMPGGFTSVRRVRPTQHVREQLLSAIERGDYPPGAALPSERVLCETFGVSRVSVREAIAGLESTGLVRVEHGKGAFVRDSANDSYVGPFAKYLTMHRDELVELLKVRGVLDELAAAEAIEHASDEGLEFMSAAEREFRSAVEAGETNLTKLSELDVAFHVSIAALSSGELLHGLVTELNEVLKESRRVTFSRPGQLQRSAVEHQAIAEAIVARDASAARDAVQQHLHQIRRWVSEIDVVQASSELGESAPPPDAPGS